MSFIFHNRQSALPPTAGLAAVLEIYIVQPTTLAQLKN